MKTSFYALLCIAIRLGAVWLAVNVLLAMPQFIAAFVDKTIAPDALWYELGFDGAALALAFLLWLYPGVLARLAAGKGSEQIFESPISAQQLLQIAMAVLGLWFVVRSVYDLTYFGMLSAVFLEYGAALTAKQKASAAAATAQLLIGFGLVLGARGISALLFRLRYSGMPLQDALTPADSEGNS